ncbi:phage minor tail protein L [Paenalcaligenes niemegkensis]|uniref:phage minor tail protein L n=1 Tax=Paenalcaligenes niemegkensis TaxID=2895469 RepID=UPI001EE83122|nr:phage minor tail protein L [Paenalcaligenes niemegkensis]MCQ9618405.1 phage minor tail protein L [Paenalcaligenes niemegkensis]
MGITADIQRLEPGDVIRLFELDATELGGDIQRFHGHKQDKPIIWQGNDYLPISIEVRGLAMATNKTTAPSFVIGNEIGGVRGAVSALCLYFRDFVGAKLTVRETFKHYLDAANFPEGNPEASNEETISIWFIEQKTSENAQQVAFELSSPADFQGQQVPTRQITSRCGWAIRGEYRGESCGYTGPPYDIEGNLTDDWESDKCNGLLRSGCKVRFGIDAELPFGGAPSSGLLKGG